MLHKFLIVKNISREGTGLLAKVLEEMRVPFLAVDLAKREEIPPLEKYMGMVVLGGPDSANDKTAKMRRELAKIQEWLKLGRPYLGICLGMQALVKAAGGKVVKSPAKEVGFRAADGSLFEVELTEEGLKDPLFAGLGKRLNVFQLHGETVELTADMKLLGAGKCCRNQVVKVGENAYGFQCHFELTVEMLERWHAEDDDLKKLDRKTLVEEFRHFHFEYTEAGEKLFRNFIDLALRSD